MRIFGAIWQYFSSICNLLYWNILEVTGWEDFPSRIWKFFQSQNFPFFSPHLPIISYYIIKSSFCQYRKFAQILVLVFVQYFWELFLWQRISIFGKIFQLWKKLEIFRPLAGITNKIGKKKQGINSLLFPRISYVVDDSSAFSPLSERKSFCGTPPIPFPVGDTPTGCLCSRLSTDSRLLFPCGGFQENPPLR